MLINVSWGYQKTSAPVGSIVFPHVIYFTATKNMLKLDLVYFKPFFAVIWLLCCNQRATPENDCPNVAWTCQFVIKSLHTLLVNHRG